MKLIFGALAIFAVVMVLCSGAGIFWLTSATLEETKQESVKILAKGLAYNVSSQMQLFEKTVSQIASDEEVILALESNDKVLIEKTAKKVQKFLPEALKVRLLPATVNSIDEQETPFMGYADLEMVKKTLTSPQPAIIQGEGANRHLAVTARIKKGGQVIGVVLASLKFDFLSTILAKAPTQDNFVEIRQNTISLGSAGNTLLKTDNLQEIKIADSPWQISYAAAAGQDIADIGSVMGIVIALSLLMTVAMFLGYYYMAGLLKKDQNKVLEAVKNLMTGKGLGAYELRLSEMQVIISTLVQFKRILDNKNGKDDETHESENIDFNDPSTLSEVNEKTDLKKSAANLFKKKK